MIQSLRRRIELLEQRIGVDPVTLHLASGELRIIRGDQRHWRALHQAWTARTTAEDAGGTLPATPLDGELDAIRSAVRIDECGGLFGLFQVLLQGPNLEGQEAD